MSTLNAMDAFALGHRYRVTHWPGSGPPLLALHGFTGAGTDFTPFVQQIGARVWAPDLLGHAGSDAPRDPAPYGFERQAKLLAALSQELGLERPLLLGYSFGGRLALRMLRDAPGAWRGAVLVGATAGIEAEDERRARVEADRALAADLEARGAAAFLEDWSRRPIIASQERIADVDRERMRAARGAHTATGLANALREAGTGRMQPLWGLLSGVQLPVLLLTGEEDSKFTQLARRLAEELPTATHALIPGAGHCAHLESPRLAGARVQAWLDRLK